MAKVVATQKGYFGGIVRDQGASFAIPDELWNDPKRRPSWVKLDPAVAFGGKGDHDGDGSVGGSRPKGGAAPVTVTNPDGSAGAVDVVVVVPPDWPNLDAMGRKVLASEIKGEAVKTAKEADAIITAYVEANKPAPFADAPAPETVRVQNEINNATGGTAPDWVAPQAVES